MCRWRGSSPRDRNRLAEAYQTRVFADDIKLDVPDALGSEREKVLPRPLGPLDQQEGSGFQVLRESQLLDVRCLEAIEVYVHEWRSRRILVDKRERRAPAPAAHAKT